MAGCAATFQEGVDVRAIVRPVMATRWTAALTWRPPVRLRRWHSRLPDHTRSPGVGRPFRSEAVPAGPLAGTDPSANAAYIRHRPAAFSGTPCRQAAARLRQTILSLLAISGDQPADLRFRGSQEQDQKLRPLGDEWKSAACHGASDHPATGDRPAEPDYHR